MKKQTNFILAASLLLSFVSCSRDEMYLIIEETGNINNSDIKRVKLTEAEMIQSGWKIVDNFALPLPSNILKANDRSVNEETVLPFKTDHLKDMGYDINFSTERQRLKNIFLFWNQAPDGITFNSNLSIDGDPNNTAPSPNISIVLGTPIVTTKTKGLDLPDESYSTEAINNGDRESEITITYSYQKGYSTSWKRTVSGSFKLGAEAGVDIPLIGEAKVSTKIVVGGKTEDGTDTSEKITEKSTYKTIVPAHSKKTITVLTKLKGSSIEYFIPIKLTGRFQANFSSPVNGHYYWSSPIESFPNFLSNVKGESGIAKSISNMSVTVLESPSEKI